MEACCELQKLLTMKVVELLTSRGITKKEVQCITSAISCVSLNGDGDGNV